MKLVAIYIRTSTYLQGKGAETQRLKCIQYCNDNDIKKFEIFEDIGESGKKVDRPELSRLMEAIKSKDVSHVIVYKLDRLGRSTIHLLEMTQAFNRFGVELVSVTQNIDTSNAMGKFFLTVLSAISEFERETISERVKAGMENAKAKGKKIGRTKKRNSKLIRSLFEDGKSLRKIASLAECSLSSVQAEIKSIPIK